MRGRSRPGPSCRGGAGLGGEGVTASWQTGGRAACLLFQGVWGPPRGGGSLSPGLTLPRAFRSRQSHSGEREATVRSSAGRVVGGLTGEASHAEGDQPAPRRAAAHGGAGSEPRPAGVGTRVPFGVCLFVCFNTSKCDAHAIIVTFRKCAISSTRDADSCAPATPV